MEQSIHELTALSDQAILGFTITFDFFVSSILMPQRSENLISEWAEGEEVR